METERQIVDFVCGTGYDDIPASARRITKDQLLAIVGTTIAGASAEGGETTANLARELGGKPEASILVHGGKVPAERAAFVNAIMARALDFCDAMVPGAHAGSAVIPAALAAAEAVGGVSGTDFLAAVCLGVELAVRLNLGEAEYDGFDPTGVCVPFGSTAAAAKITGPFEGADLERPCARLLQVRRKLPGQCGRGAGRPRDRGLGSGDGRHLRPAG